MRVLRYSAILTGVAVLVYGVYGLLTAPEIPRLSGVAYWLLGGVALHDAVLAPAVFALCWLAARRTTPRVRAVLAAVLLVAGAVTLVAAPILLHGRVAIR
ncbi:MAG: hypothetical protein JF587_09955 [Catenulisporales bacterium]|nr:hypothetical protein [Catenulisporales bacterium]